jgi:hypothetical protein
MHDARSFDMNTQKRPEQHDIRARVFALAAGFVTAALLLTGCSNDPIFATIESEAKLAEPTIVGTVSSLVVTTDNGTKNVYATNGYIWKRTNGVNSWSTISLPASDVRCSALATDALDGTGSLYALFVKTTNWSSFDSIQKYDGSSWTKVTGPSTVSVLGSGKGRIYAFVNDGTSYSVYATAAAGDVTIPSTTALASSLSLPVGTAGDYFATTTGIYYHNGSTISQLTYSGLPSALIKAITTDGTNAYLVDNGAVYKVNSSALVAAVTHSVSSPVRDAAWLDTAGTDYILIASGSSSTGGYGEIPVAADGTMGTYQTPGSSSTSSISTSARDQYESSIENYIVQKIYPITSPVPAGNDYVIYAGITYTSYDGLWSYYTTKGEWNRE